MTSYVRIVFAVSRRSLNFIVVSVLATLLLHQLVSVIVVVDALPNGAAGCAGGVAASAGFHQDCGAGSLSGRVCDSGNLAQFNTSLFINNELMDPANATALRGGRIMNWTVTASPTLPIRGVLFRVSSENEDVIFTLTGDNNLQPANICLEQPGNVEGITHNSRVAKHNVSGTMLVDTRGPIKIDLTVVYMNGRVAPDDLSVFAYNGYELDIIFQSPPIVPEVCFCTTIFGTTGRFYHRFNRGQCRQRCFFFRFPIRNEWICGGCP